MDRRDFMKLAPAAGALGGAIMVAEAALPTPEPKNAGMCGCQACEFERCFWQQFGTWRTVFPDDVAILNLEGKNATVASFPKEDYYTTVCTWPGEGVDYTTQQDYTPTDILVQTKRWLCGESTNPSTIQQVRRAGRTCGFTLKHKAQELTEAARKAHPDTRVCAAVIGLPKLWREAEPFGMMWWASATFGVEGGA